MTVLVPQHVLTDLGLLFVANGRHGFETSAMLLGRAPGDGGSRRGAPTSTPALFHVAGSK